MPLFPAIFQLSSLDGSNGFKLAGVDLIDGSGASVSAAGDINHDGFGDLIIGAPGADPNVQDGGASYVVFGHAGGFAASISLSTLTGGNGFKINGAAQFDHSGCSVSSAGDVNGDGFDDVIVGAYGAGGYDRGASYVIFGKAGGFSADLNLSALNGSNGFRIDGKEASDISGSAVHSAGDVNGDGFGDLIIGAPGVNIYDPLRDFGAAYVVFGHAGTFNASLDLATLNGSNGFRMTGSGPYEEAGHSVANAGDIDGDGFGDLIVGTASDNRCYIVYGKAAGFGATVQLDFLAMNGLGFKVSGGGVGDHTGRSVSGAGDINGDGFDDLIIGAPYAGANSSNIGTTYIVFGSATRPTANLRISDIDGSNGFRILGDLAGDSSGVSVAGAGDINGDGYDDFLIGATGADPNGGDSGASYLIFGKGVDFLPVFRLSSLNGRNGFKIAGELAGDAIGKSVSAAGDVNGDGFDDLIVGAPTGTYNDSGTSYVIFGHATRALNRTGTDGDDILSGGEFNDIFSGLGGNDWIRSGAGDDNILGGEGNDTLDGGDGNDTVTGGGGNDLLNGGLGNDVILGGDGDDVITVSGGNDDIQGLAGFDTLSFAAFSAGITLDLNTGVFTNPLNGDVQSFSLIENVIGGQGADTITGDKNANSLSGGAGNDVLIGGGGADILNGGTGRDTVTGGGGLDIFAFKTVLSSPVGAKRDIITDYTFKEKIDVSAIDADASLPGNNAFVFIGTTGFSKAGQIHVTQSGADTIIALNTSGTSNAEMEIVLTNYLANSITAADFIL